MKLSLFLALLALSTSSYASQRKCFESAQRAAFSHVKDNVEIVTMKDFQVIYTSAEVKVENHVNWQTELWAFYNDSSIIDVEVHVVNENCFVKKVDLSQNDQDQE